MCCDGVCGVVWMCVRMWCKARARVVSVTLSDVICVVVSVSLLVLFSVSVSVRVSVSVSVCLAFPLACCCLVVGDTCAAGRMVGAAGMSAQRERERERSQ